VQVVNARHVAFTGRKMKDKKYYWHTMHPGGLKSITPKALMEKDRSEEVRVTEVPMNCGDVGDLTYRLGRFLLLSDSAACGYRDAAEEQPKAPGDQEAAGLS
jgi:hypothetical protein